MSDTALTPCSGRCSTVFGDSVCRGCLRYSQEVIDWNRYGPQAQKMIWQRLDAQVDQIVLPLIPIQCAKTWQLYKDRSVLKLPTTVSEGRWRYEVFKTCLRSPQETSQTGLHLDQTRLRVLWFEIEKKLYALAVAMYEIAWLRAATIISDENMRTTND